MDKIIYSLVNDLTEMLAPAAIILHGSRIYGNPRDDSDYDVVIVSHNHMEDAKITEIRLTIENSYGISLDLRACTVEGLKLSLALDPEIHLALKRGIFIGDVTVLFDMPLSRQGISDIGYWAKVLAEDLLSGSDPLDSEDRKDLANILRRLLLTQEVVNNTYDIESVSRIIASVCENIDATKDMIYSILYALEKHQQTNRGDELLKECLV